MSRTTFKFFTLFLLYDKFGSQNKYQEEEQLIEPF